MMRHVLTVCVASAGAVIAVPAGAATMAEAPYETKMACAAFEVVSAVMSGDGSAQSQAADARARAWVDHAFQERPDEQQLRADLARHQDVIHGELEQAAPSGTDALIAVMRKHAAPCQPYYRAQPAAPGRPD